MQLSLSSQIIAAANCSARLKQEAIEAEARRAAINLARRGPSIKAAPGEKTLTATVYEALPRGRSNGINLSGVAALIGQNTVEGRKRASGALQTLLEQKKVGAQGDRRSKVYWRY